MRGFLAGRLANIAFAAAASPVQAATGGAPPPPSAWAAANTAAYQRAQADLVAAQAAEADLDQQLAAAEHQVVAAQPRAADDKQNARHIAWGGPNALVVFTSPPNPVDPAAAEAAKFGPR
jgi:hypothetical protein